MLKADAGFSLAMAGAVRIVVIAAAVAVTVLDRPRLAVITTAFFLVRVRPPAAVPFFRWIGASDR